MAGDLTSWVLLRQSHDLSDRGPDSRIENEENHDCNLPPPPLQSQGIAFGEFKDHSVPEDTSSQDRREEAARIPRTLLHRESTQLWQSVSTHFPDRLKIPRRIDRVVEVGKC